MITKGIVKFQGIGSGTCYILNKDFVNKNIPNIDNNKVAISSDKVAISNDNLSKNENKIIQYLKNNEFVTNATVRNLTSLSQAGARKMLSNMVTKKLIYAEGEKRGRKYKISKSIKNN